MKLSRDNILSKFYRNEKLTKAEINWLAEQEFDQFSQGIESEPLEEQIYKVLARDKK
jgi:hypothetical protein